MRKIFKSTAFWIVTFLLILSACLTVIILKNNIHGNVVKVYVEDEIFTEIPLQNDGEYPIITQYGTNILQIKDGGVRVLSADCQNQICVNYGWVTQPEKPLICAPHKLVVMITDDSDKGGNDL